MKFAFVIETGSLSVKPGDSHSIYSRTEQVFVVVADDLDGACQRMHQHLLAENPSGWSDDWQDLRYDIEEGNQTCYGPFEDIPVLI